MKLRPLCFRQPALLSVRCQHVSALFFLAFLCSLGLPQFGVAAVNLPLTWRWSNPYPHGNNIIDMASIDGLLIQIAERGQIYTSADLQTWFPRDSHTTNALRAITSFQGRIFITGENGTTLHGDSAAKLKLIQLGTSDWLEGIAASPSRLVAVGDNAAIYTSGDGTNWQRQTASFTNWLRSVTYGTPSGVGTFLTVGEAGLIASSLDGVRWQRRTSPTALHLNKAGWSGGLFWAVGEGGQAFTSTSGLSWQPVNSGATNTLNAISGTNGSRLLVGDSEVRLSERAGAWSNELDAFKQFPAPLWTYLCALWDGQSYLVGGRTGVLVEGFKTNSTTSPTFWLPIAESSRSWLWDVKRFPSLYLAVGDQATILSSLDGIEWAEELAPESASSAIFLGIGGTPNLAVAVGSGGTIIVSPDELKEVITANADGTTTTNRVSGLGILWHAVTPRPSTNDLQGITALGGLLIASGGGGTILTSADGTNWVRRPTPASQFLSSVEAFPGGAVAVGKDGTILTSSDAISWTRRSPPTTQWIYRVRYLGGRLIAVGQNGMVLTSPDGVTWISQNSGTTRWLNDVQWIDNTYFAIGTQGTVVISTNAAQWTTIGTMTQKSLYGAASHNGQLLLVGIEGAILRSQISPFPTPLRFVEYPHDAAQNLFLFAGQTDQRFTLDRSTNLADWVTGPDLEIVDRSGTLLYLDDRTNAPSFQFFRAKPKP